MKGICLWCKQILELTRHHHPIKKVDGGTKTILICLPCHQKFHGTEPKTKKVEVKVKPKKEKVYERCAECKVDLTGKISEIDGKKICFKCFVRWRVEQRAIAEKKKHEWVPDWIKLKKWFCPECKLRKSDLEVVFAGLKGVDCQKCGNSCSKLNIQHLYKYDL